jgi:hypothetical protein
VLKASAPLARKLINLFDIVKVIVAIFISWTSFREERELTRVLPLEISASHPFEPGEQGRMNDTHRGDNAGETATRPRSVFGLTGVAGGLPTLCPGGLIRRAGLGLLQSNDLGIDRRVLGSAVLTVLGYDFSSRLAIRHRFYCHAVSR